MATGTGNLPNPGMSFTPFDILTAAEMNDLVENIESLADGTGIGDGSVDTAAIADEAVTADKIDWTTLGWQTWTPSWTNLTVGSGTLSASYFKIGKIVFYQLSFTYGSGSSVGSNPTFTLPSTASSDYMGGPIGSSYFEDANGTDYVGLAWIASTTTGSFRVSGAGGSYSDPNPISATAPFTWASGDKIMTEGCYRES